MTAWESGRTTSDHRRENAGVVLDALTRRAKIRSD